MCRNFYSQLTCRGVDVADIFLSPKVSCPKFTVNTEFAEFFITKIGYFGAKVAETHSVAPSSISFT